MGEQTGLKSFFANLEIAIQKVGELSRRQLVPAPLAIDFFEKIIAILLVSPMARHFIVAGLIAEKQVVSIRS